MVRPSSSPSLARAGHRTEVLESRQVPQAWHRCPQKQDKCPGSPFLQLWLQPSVCHVEDTLPRPSQPWAGERPGPPRGHQEVHTCPASFTGGLGFFMYRSAAACKTD